MRTGPDPMLAATRFIGPMAKSKSHYQKGRLPGSHPRNEVRESYVKKADIRCSGCTANEDIKAIRGNLAYKVGDFVKSKPKAAASIVVIVVLVSLIILGYADAQAIRLVIAHAIGVPDELLVTPIP